MYFIDKKANKIQNIKVNKQIKNRKNKTKMELKKYNGIFKNTMEK